MMMTICHRHLICKAHTEQLTMVMTDDDDNFSFTWIGICIMYGVQFRAHDDDDDDDDDDDIHLCSLLIIGVARGRMKMQVLKNQVPGGGIIKYGKTKYEWQGWKMQVQTVKIKSSTITHQLY